MADQTPIKSPVSQVARGEGMARQHYGGAQVGSASELSKKIPSQENQGEMGDPSKMQSMQEFHKSSLKPSKKLLPIILAVVFVLLISVAVFYYF